MCARRWAARWTWYWMAAPVAGAWSPPSSRCWMGRRACCAPALPLAALREALGEAGIAGAGSSAPAPRVPGALTSHYAPATPLEIHAGEGLAIRAESALAEGLRVAVLRRDLGQGGEAAGFAVPQFFLPAQAEAYARALYARLRDIDRAAFDLLLVEAPPRSEDWWAVHDRLARAAGGRGPPTLLP